jgi:hypothetical protein
MLPKAEDATVRGPLLEAVKAAEAAVSENVRSRLQW